MFMDNIFEVLEADLNKIHIALDTTAGINHVPEIERKICVNKECVHNIWNTLQSTTLVHDHADNLLHHPILYSISIYLQNTDRYYS